MELSEVYKLHWSCCESKRDFLNFTCCVASQKPSCHREQARLGSAFDPHDVKLGASHRPALLMIPGAMQTIIL